MTSTAVPADSGTAPEPRPPALSRRLLAAAWLLPAVAVSAVVYYPITRNYFFADDFLNLYNIVNDQVLQYLVTPNGGHLLLTRNAIFWLSFQLFGAAPEFYYWSVFLAHLLNVCLLFRLVYLMTGSALLASFGAALWGVSPLNEGSLGWYSVYGHVLVATALLLILGQAQRVAAEGRIPGPLMRVWWYVLALAAATCFGTGIAVALLLPFVLLLLFPHWPGRAWWRPPLASLLIVLPVLYIGLNRVYARLAGQDILRETPWLTLVSDPLGISLIWLKLTAIGLTRLVLGFYFPPWIGPPLWYAVLGVFVVAGIAVARMSPAPVRRRMAAIALLVLGCYGIIATARAVLVLAIAPNLVTEIARYHYVGQLLLSVLLCLILARLRSVVPAWAAALLLVGWYGVTLASYVNFAPPIDHHLRAREDTARSFAMIQRFIRRSPKGKPIFVPNRSFLPLPFPPAQFPGWAAAFVIFRPVNHTIDGRPIYFIEQDPDVLEAAARGKRTKGLFVTPERWRAETAPEGAK